ncbi:DUF5984 family protein [Deinococcus aquaedulcis]|uniref:DUF5984 family protein n=1 Tax=Deinococcus aquaedulcis TaxID=2840455 RepID=UPI001C82E5B6|nr:DUF5984 family protein [Deinococcus aquaedulcis]
MSPLFGFRLQPLPALIQAWEAGGFDPQVYLRGWYWLSYGWFWLTTPDGDVPTTHPALNAAFGLPPDPEPHLDYQVARLWLDLDEILPRVLEPLPPALASVLASGSWAGWKAQVSAWQHARPDEQADWDAWLTATGWENGRVLDMGYLAAPPVLRFWREGETVTMSWDTTNKRVDGHLCWAETQGQQRLSVTAFQADTNLKYS